jgi:plasmid maintenance system antidote protein VapI
MAKRKTIADVLRNAIRESGLTHYRIAKDAGIKPDMIDRFVFGKRDLRLGTAAKIADVLGLELVKRNSKRKG